MSDQTATEEGSMSESNGNGRMTWSMLITIVALLGGLAAILVPMQKGQEKVEKWQDDYMRGLIPSSAERELAAQKMQFVEVETQFKGQRDKIDRHEGEIERIRGQMEMTLEQVAVLNERYRNGRPLVGPK